MEKRKVRIYKSHDGEGKYINKTKKFLDKAQMGMQTQNESADVEQQLQSVKYYIKGLKNESVDDNQILKVLVSKGLRKDIATALIVQVSEELEEEERKLEEEADAENQPNAEETEMGQEEANVKEQQAEEEEDYESAGYDEAIAEDDNYMNPNMEYGYGGRVGKKKFTNNVLKLLKKKEGGEEKALGQGSRFDNMNNDASTKKSSFLEKIKEISNKAAVDELYEKMMQSNNPELIESANKMAEERNKPAEGTFEEAQSGGFIGDKQPDMFMYGGTDMPFYEADVLPEAKRGIISGKAYNTRTKEEYKDSFEGLSPYAKTVHKRGLLGRPKQWTEYYSKSTGKPIVPTDKDKNLKHGVEKELWDDLSGKAKREIRRGDRQLGREARRGADSMKEDAKFNKGVHAEYKYENPEDLARDQKRSDDAWDKDKSFVSDIDHEGAPYKHVITKKRDLGNGEYRWDPVNIPSDPSYDNLYSDLDNAELPTVVDDFDYTSMITPMDFEDSRVMNERDQADKELIINSGSTKDFLKFHGAKMQDLLNIEKEYRTDETEEPMLPQTFQFKPGKSKAQEFENLQEDLENEEQSDFKNQKYGFRYGGLPKAQTGLPPEKKESDATTTTNQFGNIMSKNNGLDNEKSINPNNPPLKGMPDNLQFFGEYKKEEQPEDDIIAIDKQRAPSNFTGADGVNAFNVGATAVTGFMNNLDTAKQQKEMYDNNFTSDNMYAASNSKDRGDYGDYGGQGLGQLRYDQMGSNTSGRFAYGQEGGYMEEGGYVEGGVVDMTEEELEEFLANGGEVEYLES